MTSLLDTNLLIALTWPNHTSHGRARRWFRGVRRFATCPLTQLGFCRVSVHLKYATDPANAMAAIRAWVTHPSHEFWPDSLALSDPLLPAIQGHQQFTDAYLLALARKNRGRLATLDAGIASLVAASPEHVELI